MKVLNKHSVVASVAIATAAILLIFNALIQILCSGAGIAFPLFMLATLGFFFFVGAYCFRKYPFSRHLNRYPLLITGLGFAFIILLVLAEVMFPSIYIPLTPVFVLLAIVIFSTTAVSVKKHTTAGCLLLWLEMVIICLIVGFAQYFEAIFAVSVIGTVTGVIYVLNAERSVPAKICNMVLLFSLLGENLVVVGMVLDESILDFFVNRLFFPDYVYYSEKSALLPHLGRIGSHDPINVLLSGVAEFGPAVWIIAGVLMLILLICSVLLLRGKGGAARYLHIGATTAMAISFIGNFCYLFGFGNLFTSDAAFLNANAIFVVFDLILLLLIVNKDSSADVEDMLSPLDEELDRLNGHDPNSGRVTSHIFPISGSNDEIVKEFVLHKNEIAIRSADLEKAAEGKKEAMLISYHGQFSELCKAFQHFTIRADACFAKMLIDVDSPTEEVDRTARELLDHLPENTALHIVTKACKEGNCNIYILTL